MEKQECLFIKNIRIYLHFISLSEKATYKNDMDKLEKRDDIQ
jgi:hypothetical protein